MARVLGFAFIRYVEGVMTLDELVDVYFSAGGTGDGSTRGAIRQVVLALRDHLRQEAPQWSNGWGIIEVENEINEILGDAVEKEPSHD